MNYDEDIEGESTLKPTQEATVKRLSKEKYRAKIKLLSHFISIWASLRPVQVYTCSNSTLEKIVKFQSRGGGCSVSSSISPQGFAYSGSKW